jgi:hypothetical protein
VGDFNARIDVYPTPTKTADLLDTLGQLGYVLANKPTLSTYICHSGSSAIDLVFYNPNMCDLGSQKYASDLSPSIKKHQPIETVLRVTSNYCMSSPVTFVNPLTRKVDVQKLNNSMYFNDVHEALVKQDVNTAIGLLNQILRDSIPQTSRRKRHAKPWFDGDCYQSKQYISQLLILARVWPQLYGMYEYGRMRYKYLLNMKRREYYVRQERALIDSAEQEPHKFLAKSSTRISCPISLERWVLHFKEILFCDGYVSYILNAQDIQITPLNLS